MPRSQRGPLSTQSRDAVTRGEVGPLAAGIVTPLTRTGAYTLGGTTGQGNYGTQSNICVRSIIHLTKRATRLRIHVSNTIGLYGGIGPNGVSVSAAAFGQRLGTPGSAGMVRTGITVSGTGSLDNGGEWVSAWITPDFDTSMYQGLLTLQVSTNGAQVANSFSVNAWYSNSGVAPGDPNPNPTGGWTAYGDTPLATWIEYEYDDDGSLQVLFLGDSIVDGYYQGPFQQASGPMANWFGHVSSWPEAWARKRNAVAIVNAYASAKANDFGSDSAKWTRFATTASPVLPDAICVHIGGNDILNGGDLTGAQTVVRNMLAVTRSKYPGVPVHFVGVFPLLSSNTNPTIAANRVALNTYIASLGRDELQGYIEPSILYDPASGASEYIRSKYVSPDNTHLNPMGYEVMAQAIDLSGADARTIRTASGAVVLAQTTAPSDTGALWADIS